MTHTLTVPRSLEHIVETECSPRVVAMSSYLQNVWYRCGVYLADLVTVTYIVRSHVDVLCFCCSNTAKTMVDVKKKNGVIAINVKNIE